jgi:hypothetical protein
VTLKRAGQTSGGVGDGPVGDSEHDDLVEGDVGSVKRHHDAHSDADGLAEVDHPSRAGGPSERWWLIAAQFVGVWTECEVGWHVGADGFEGQGSVAPATENESVR